MIFNLRFIKKSRQAGCSRSSLSCETMVAVGPGLFGLLFCAEYMLSCCASVGDSGSICKMGSERFGSCCCWAFLNSCAISGLGCCMTQFCLEGR